MLFGLFDTKKKEISTEEWWLTHNDISDEHVRYMCIKAYHYYLDKINNDLPEEVRTHATRREAECKSYILGYMKYARHTNRLRVIVDNDISVSYGLDPEHLNVLNMKIIKNDDIVKLNLEFKISDIDAILNDLEFSNLLKLNNDNSPLRDLMNKLRDAKRRHLTA